MPQISTFFVSLAGYFRPHCQAVWGHGLDLGNKGMWKTYRVRQFKSEDVQEILMCGFSYIFHLNDPKNTAFQFATPCASAKQWENATDSEVFKKDNSAEEDHQQWAGCLWCPTF